MNIILNIQWTCSNKCQKRAILAFSLMLNLTKSNKNILRTKILSFFNSDKFMKIIIKLKTLL